MGAERRLVTVLFADLVGSTEIGAKTDPELLRDQLTRYFDWIKEIAESHGGTVEKFAGDAVTVFFGVPRIHDDDAERAVRCGLSIQATVDDLNAELGTGFSIRIGVNTGEAVVQFEDDGQFIVGDPINISQRLEQDADPGEVVVGPLTEQLTRTAIEYERRKPTIAKGQPMPIRAFRAVRSRTAVPERLGKTAPVRAPLVGRERELRFLIDTFGRVAEDQQAHLLLLLGPAGIGKSRLIDEGLKQIGEERQLRVLQGRCLPYGKGITYWPLVEILQQDCDISFEDDRESALGKLRRRVKSLGLSDEIEQSLTAHLSPLLGLSQGSAVPTDEGFQAETAFAIRRYLVSLAKVSPVVVVVDDLQWAEEPILRLLENVTSRTAQAPLLWFCIARPEFDEQHPGWGRASPNASRMTLNPLTRAETSTLMTRLLETSSASPALLQHLVERSEGNPLFCEEFLRMILERETGTNAAERHAGEAIPVPESIHALLATRLDSLPNTEKLTLQIASVIGERFTVAQVRALANHDGMLEASLDRLLIKGLLFDDSAAADSGSLRFKHLLLRDVAYSSLPKSERAELHHRLAMYMETEYKDRIAGLAEIINYHAAKALELAHEMRMPNDRLRRYVDLALKWGLWLADRAALRDDMPIPAELIANCQKILEPMPANEYPAERLRTALLAAERCRAISEYAEGRSIADRVREQAEALQRWDLAAAAALSAARIELRRDAPTCRRLATEAAALFRKVGDQLGELDCEWLLAFDQAGSGGGEPAMRRAAAVIDAALELKQFSRAALWMPITAGFLGSTGFPNEARAMYERSIELAQRIGSPPEKGIHLGLARLDALSNRYDEGIDRVKRALADEEWDRFPTLFACRTIGILLLRAGRLAEAGEYLERGVRLSEETGERMSRSELCARRAIAAVYEGKLDVGADYAKRAIDTAQADDPSAQFESHWALAELRWAEGRESDAYESFKVGFSRLTYYDDVTVEVVLRFARFLIETGRADEARPLLDRANEWLETAGYLYGRSEIAKLREKLIQSEGSRLLY